MIFGVKRVGVTWIKYSEVLKLLALAELIPLVLMGAA